MMCLAQGTQLEVGRFFPVLLQWFHSRRMLLVWSPTHTKLPLGRPGQLRLAHFRNTYS
jgi:hypothetical protein